MTKKKRSASSSRWLQEHVTDPFVHKAQKLGLRSRASFKLEEIQQKDKLIKSGMTVVDLGSAPGSWSQIAAKVTDSSDDDIRVAAIDFLEMAQIPGVKILQLDFLDPDVAPGVGTTVPGGATFREAHLIMELLHDSELVSSLDLVELNPFLDDRGRSARVMVDLAASLFGRRILDRPTRGG